MPPGLLGMSRELKLTTEVEFGSLVCLNWVQNQETSKKCQKTSLLDVFLVNSEVFQNFQYWAQF